MLRYLYILTLDQPVLRLAVDDGRCAEARVPAQARVRAHHRRLLLHRQAGDEVGRPPARAQRAVAEGEPRARRPGRAPAGALQRLRAWAWGWKFPGQAVQAC